jgi:hypothetical protein
MSDTRSLPPPDPVEAAYHRGRRVGLATAALAVSVVAYINLLGIEKSLLAAVLAVSALRGAGFVSLVLRRGRAALIIAVVHAISVAAVVVLFHDQFMQLIRLLHKLG